MFPLRWPCALDAASFPRACDPPSVGCWALFSRRDLPGFFPPLVRIVMKSKTPFSFPPPRARSLAAGSRRFFVFWSLLALLGASPRLGWACACGCGIFEVGTDSMAPQGAGQMLFLENDFQDQDRNWHGDSPAPAADNPDRDIRTDFVTAGYQDMFNRDWGLQVDVPYVQRHFVTTGGATGSGLVALNWGGLGDLRIEGVYTGLSSDLSTGLTFGVKLPTGSYMHEDAFGDIDRDSEIGSGSTDLILGAFHRGRFTRAPRWVWFTQAGLDLPVFTSDQYRPGTEIDAAAGLYYQAWTRGANGITPMLQLKASDRTSDGGANASNPVASGFRRVLVVPGLEFDLHQVTIVAEVGLPAYQHFTGNQLAAPVLLKLSVSHRF